MRGLMAELRLRGCSWTAREAGRRGRLELIRAAMGLIAAIAFGIVPSGAAGAGSDLESLLEGYRGARSRGALGDVMGRIYDEPARRSAPARPRASVPVVLLPLNAARAAEFEAVKADARRSMQSYRAVAAELDALGERYVAAMRSAGGVDLVRQAATDGDGAFRFDQVPAGEWMLIARLEISRQVARPRPVPKTQAEEFSGNLEHHGHGTVVYWWRAIEVRSGESTTLELTDRNAALTAVKEDRRPPPGTPAPFLPNR
jgi:hypothetical protein